MSSQRSKIELLQGSMIFQFQFPFSGSIEDYWDFISNTEKINRAIGTGSVDYHLKPKEYGSSILFGKTTNAGIVSEYIEYPYEWLENKYLTVYREYTKGPVKKMSFRNEVITLENGFILEMLLQFVPSNPIYKPFIWYEAKKNAYPRFKKLFETIQDAPIKKFRWFDFKSKKYDTNSVEYKNLYNKFIQIDSDHYFADKLTDYILNSSDHDLLKIKPYRLGKYLGLDKNQVLFFLLKATKAGLFDLNWDILCPYCKGAGHSSTSLKSLEKDVHCTSCNIDYSADFDQSVEVTFTPHPIIRTLNAGIYCIGGPGNTPHIRSQLKILPNEIRELEMYFKEGIYKLYSLQNNDNLLNLSIENKSYTKSVINYPSNASIALPVGEHKIIIKNSFNKEIYVKLERMEYLEDIVTANMLTTLQEFRNLFSSEVLRPGQEISIKNISILFTDLKGSTEIYNKFGDALAFKLVGDHFEILIENAKLFNGAIVKTIGDAVMAVFINPLDAIKYSLQIQKEIQVLNEKLNNQKILLKIGIHSGSTLAVNLNDRLDYFGSTVNQAARIESKCKGGDIVISKEILEHEGVKDTISIYKRETFFSELKGFDNPIELTRIVVH